jgi:hypothetical protein
MRNILEQNSNHISYALFYNGKNDPNKSITSKTNKHNVVNSAQSKKYPFKWTLIGVVLLSALFWLLVYKLLF